MSQAVSFSASPSVPYHPEKVNQLTHGLGFALTVPAAICAIIAASSSCDTVGFWGCVVFGITMMGVYGASTLSHSFDDKPAVKDLWRVLDQVAIYAFIAGCFTPFALTYARHPFGITALVLMWVMCLAGMARRILRRGKPLNSLDIAFSVTAGWIPVVTLLDMITAGGAIGLTLVFTGALAYLVGIYFLMNDHRSPYWHAVWHLCTMTGTACHYAFLMLFIIC
ncbi:PAQR family membrane homeostasis protein TrhA [Calycomorphotria hydatis]|uniref:Hemolysin-III related n=1 Tax=Calycomorphotria hydatis TaxID=2528027 RepID=A0A517T5C8_9PLAN|nr:hemolysin III family protein [Calycomorphotria hydatis]QDT63551.1 hemolysin-III related [Calycomorphotria hydatis]